MRLDAIFGVVPLIIHVIDLGCQAGCIRSSKRPIDVRVLP